MDGCFLQKKKKKGVDLDLLSISSWKEDLLEGIRALSCAVEGNQKFVTPERCVSFHQTPANKPSV